jgi:hypothetical protein
MQAITAGDSLVMTTPLDETAAAASGIAFTEQLRQFLFGQTEACTHKSRLFGNRWLPQTTCALPFWTYEEFIGAKKHLVLRVLSHTAPRR